MRKKDLEQGTDIRGDIALFIEERHFKEDGWTLDNTTKKYIQLNLKGEDNIYFRVIKNGVQQNGHGWIDVDGDIFQWG